MATIIEKLQKEAEIFMHKHRKIENDVVKNINQILIYYKKLINKYFLGISDVTLARLQSMIENEIKPIITLQKEDMEREIEKTIKNQYETGIDEAGRLLQFTNRQLQPIDKDNFDEEILLALTLFGKRLISNFNDDLLNSISTDLSSIYIISKNNNRDTDNYSTVKTNIKGEDASKYISPTFNKYMNRAEVIGRTETNRALNHGMLLTYLAVKRTNRSYSNMAVKWVEIRDQKLCRYCKEKAEGGDYGNGVYDIGTISPPPLHARCRCVLIPYLLGWETEVF